jgi:bacteriocin biosynthesis cyclodehydratase domain-containing protein
VVAAIAPEDVVAIERLARAAHRAKRVSLWAHELGGSVVLGPLVVPGETACRACATAEPLHPMMPSVARAARVRGASPALLGDLVAMEALQILRGDAPSRLGGRVLIEDLATWTSSLHTLVRLPWCRVCGAAG